MESLNDDPNGPHIDLRKELIMHLGQRVTMVTDYQLPITTSSERLLFAIEVKDEKAVAAALVKLLKNDPTVKRRVINGRVIWEIVEEETPKVPSISLGEVPSLDARRMPTRRPATREDEGEEKESHFLPHGAVTVAQGQLLVASHLDFLLKVLKPIPKADTLAESPEYKNVAGTVAKLGMAKRCAGEFSRIDEAVRPTYELIRQGKMPESESLLGRAMNTLSGAAKKGVPRSQQINGKNLPDFKVVAPSLGLGGIGATSEPDGWFIKGFLLPKPAAEKAMKPSARRDTPSLMMMVTPRIIVQEEEEEKMGVPQNNSLSRPAPRCQIVPGFALQGMARPVEHSNFAQKGCWRSPRVRASSNSVSRLGARLEEWLFILWPFHTMAMGRLKSNMPGESQTVNLADWVR